MTDDPAPDSPRARRTTERLALLIAVAGLALTSLVAVIAIPVIINRNAQARQDQTQCLTGLQGRFDVAVAHAIDATSNTPTGSPQRAASLREIHDAGEALANAQGTCFG